MLLINNIKAVSNSQRTSFINFKWQKYFLNKLPFLKVLRSSRKKKNTKTESSLILETSKPKKYLFDSHILIRFLEKFVKFVSYHFTASMTVKWSRAKNDCYARQNNNTFLITQNNNFVFWKSELRLDFYRFFFYMEN